MVKRKKQKEEGLNFSEVEHASSNIQLLQPNELSAQARATLEKLARAYFSAKDIIAGNINHILETVIDCLDHDNAFVRLRAAQLLKEWGFGKPIQISQIQFKQPMSIIVKDTKLDYD